MAGEEPPYLPVGTDVSAKYRGAFCEAKVKKVVKTVKCKVLLTDTHTNLVVLDDSVKGPIKVGAKVEVKPAETSEYVPAVINKVTDNSVYTVVFDDGDENTLRRTQLCLKGEKHFVQSETLDQLPLTHPEHFGTPVMQQKKSFKRRRSGVAMADSESEESSDESIVVKRTYRGRLQDLIGRVLCMEIGERKRTVVVPVLVVNPNADDLELKTKDHLLVKSFKDSKFYAVTKKDTKEFTREMCLKNEDKSVKGAYEKALLYSDTKELPKDWDKEDLLGSDTEEDEDSDSSDDEPSEEKDRFVAQLYKFMDDRGTPINKAPVISNRDLSLYKLFKLVQNLGGYNRVTNQMKWRLVYSKMNLPTSTTASNQIKTAYKKYLHAFEDFYRKLGSTMGTISRPGRSRHSSGRSLLSFRDKDAPKSPRSADKKVKDEKEEEKDREVTKPKSKEKDSDKAKDTEKTEKQKVIEKEDKDKSKSKTDDKKSTKEEPEVETEIATRKSRSRTSEDRKTEKEKEPSKPVTREDMAKMKEEAVKNKEDTKKAVKEEETRNLREDTKKASRESEETQRPSREETRKNREDKNKATVEEAKVEEKKAKADTANGDDDDKEEGRQPKKRNRKKSARVEERMEKEENKEKRQKKETKKEKQEEKKVEVSSAKSVDDKGEASEHEDEEEEVVEKRSDRREDNREYPLGTKLQVKYGRGRNTKIYEAKVVEAEMENGALHYLVHYAGWNNRYDEWVKRDRIVNKIDDGPSKKIKPKMLSPSPKSPKQSQPVKATTATESPSQKKRGGRTNAPTPPGAPQSRSTAIKSKSPAGATGPPTKARPTRSNSVEMAYPSGLPPKAPRRTRRSSGYTESSDQQSHVSDSDSDDGEESMEEAESPEVKPTISTKNIEEAMDLSPADSPDLPPLIIESQNESIDFTKMDHPQVQTEKKEDFKDIKPKIVEQKPTEEPKDKEKAVCKAKEPVMLKMEEDEQLSCEVLPVKPGGEYVEQSKPVVSKKDKGKDTKQAQNKDQAESVKDNKASVSSKKERLKESKMQQTKDQQDSKDTKAANKKEKVKEKQQEETKADKEEPKQVKVPEDQKTLPEASAADADDDSEKAEEGADTKTKARSRRREPSKAKTKVTVEAKSETMKAVDSPVNKAEETDKETPVLDKEMTKEISVPLIVPTFPPVLEVSNKPLKEKEILQISKSEKEKVKADKAARSKVSKDDKLKAEKGDKEKPSKADKVEKERTAKSDKTEKEKHVKAEKTEKDKSNKLDKNKVEKSEKGKVEEEEDWSTVDAVAQVINEVVETVRERSLEFKSEPTKDVDKPEKKKKKKAKKKKLLEEENDDAKSDSSSLADRDRDNKVARVDCSGAVEESGSSKLVDSVKAEPVEAGPLSEPVPLLKDIQPKCQSPVLVVPVAPKPEPSVSPHSVLVKKESVSSWDPSLVLAELSVEPVLLNQQNTYQAPVLVARPIPTTSSTATTVMDNTPPETPEHSPMAPPPPTLSPPHEESFLSKADQEVGMEEDSLVEPRLLPVAGGESPGACDTSTISNGSSVGSSGNAPSSESSNEATAAAKRKQESGEHPPAKRRKRGHKRSSVHGDKSRGKDSSGKQSNSDSDEASTAVQEVLPGPSSAPVHQPPASILPGSASPSKPHSTATTTCTAVPTVRTRSPRPSKYNFNLDEGKYLEGEKRIEFLQSKIGEIRKIYMSLKAEVACIDRRRKRARRKEREGSSANQPVVTQVEVECS